ncbi:MAG: hypothetical protein D6767_04925 [Candidatus Hydrogenedentota bacterium]|nr:MAG: hypothetical protein D6767_04925 [Candidatus Hydrogenedentota bacterium]
MVRQQVLPQSYKNKYLFSFDGLVLAGGISYSENKIGVAQADKTGVTFSSGSDTIKATWDRSSSIDSKISVLSFLGELRSGISVLYALNFYSGVGFAIHRGGTNLNIKNNGYIRDNGDGSKIDGNLTVNLTAFEKPTVITAYGLLGVEINFFAFRIGAEAQLHSTGIWAAQTMFRITYPFG